jgi:hypothetical protein
MKSQLDEMRSSSEQTDKIIKANAKLADAATKSSDTADKNLVATQRAWVGSIDSAIVKGGNETIIRPELNSHLS